MKPATSSASASNPQLTRLRSSERLLTSHSNASIDSTNVIPTTAKDCGESSHTVNIEMISPKPHSRLLEIPKEVTNNNNSSTSSSSLFNHPLFIKYSQSLGGEQQFWSYLYLVTWFLLNIVITLYCKALFSVYKFPYPMLMTTIHMLFTTLGVFGCQWLGLYTPKSLPPEMRTTILWFSIVFTVNIWLSNASLLAVSVNLHQVVRTIIPLFTMGISLLFFGDRYPASLLPSVLLVILGVTLTVWGDLDFTPFGLFVVLLGCVFSSLKGIITQKTQVGSLGLSSLDLLRYLCPLAIVQLLLLATFMGETSRLINDPNIALPLIIHLSLLGWVAFALNFVSFRCAALLNPLTLNIAGNVKQVCTCLLSLAVFGGVLSVALSFGIFGTAVGAYWYSREMGKWRHLQKQAVKAADHDLEQQQEDYENSTTASSNNDNSDGALSFVDLREEAAQQQRNRLINNNDRKST